MKYVSFLCLYVLLFNFCNGGKILMVNLVPFASYTNFMKAILEILAPYHQITLISSAHKDISHPNVTLYKLTQPYLHIASREDIFTALQNSFQFNVILRTILGMTDNYIDATFMENETLKKLIKEKPKYDLFFSFSHLSEHLYPLAHVTNATLIQLSAAAPLPWQSNAIGNSLFLSTDNSLFTDPDADLLIGRIKNYLKSIIMSFSYYWYYLPSINKSVKKHFPPNTPTIENIADKAALLFVNIQESMGFLKYSLSNYVEIGGLHCRPAKQLPYDIDKFIEDSNDDGFIYVSFGTTVTAEFPKKVKDVLINVFKKLPQRIIWKWNYEVDELPDNIKMGKWFPQQDILGHKKIKLFITHGGMLSLQEGVYHGVPLLVIPIIFDQPSNAHTVNKLGYGKSLDFYTITEEKFEKQILEVLQNPTYKRKIQVISELMKDKQNTPAERLIWWTDYVIRHNGYPLRQITNKQLSWYQIIELDVFLTIVFFIFLFYNCIIIILRRIKKFFHNNLKVKIL